MNRENNCVTRGDIMRVGGWQRNVAHDRRHCPWRDCIVASHANNAELALRRGGNRPHDLLRRLAFIRRSGHNRDLRSRAQSDARVNPLIALRYEQLTSSSSSYSRLS
jgi:hypothetical protein